MDPRDRETIAPPSQDETVVFAAAARQVVTAVQLSPAEVASHYEQIHARIARADIAPPVLPPSNTQSLPSRTPISKVPRGIFKIQPLRRGVWYSLTAAIVVMMTIALGWPAGLLHHTIHIDGPVSTYVTGNGERANITLPDGNTVALNVASHLEVPADYLAGDHTVRLRGEALFNVIQHTSTPFSVVAGQTTTQVLGTSFLVRHYTTDSATTVAVREGKVRVGAAVVTANRLVEVRGSGLLVSGVAAPSRFGFATGTLTLDQLPLPAAVTELDRWYDADIRLANPAMASRYVISGKFAVGSLSDLTVYLELILDVRVVRHGRVLTLYPK